MGSFRYRTAALVGAWRATEDEAMEDAVRARQMVVGGNAANQWLVPGGIEARNLWSAPGVVDPWAPANDQGQAA